MGRHRTTWWKSGSSPSLRRVSPLGRGIFVVAQSASRAEWPFPSRANCHLVIWAAMASLRCSGA
eukprot:4289086-Pyramimonas_sp.AAC.1